MGPRIWSQSIARASLVGGRTHNPAPAAAALLGARGKRRFRRAVRRVGQLRRSFHRGNPLPAVLGVVGGLGGLGGRFKTPSEKRAAGPAAQLVAAAVAGNLTAVKAIAERTEIGIQKERAVWRKAFTQVPPSMVALFKKFMEQVPGVDHSTPDTAAETALARAVDGNALEAEARRGRVAIGEAAARRAAQVEARQERREQLVAGVGGQIGAALLGRGRGLRRPTRRRRRAPRAFSF